MPDVQVEITVAVASSAFDALASHIRSGKLFYIGSCAGACIASTSYGGSKTMQLIPGIINVSDNEDQIVVRPADVPQVTLTKQIAVMIHGADPHAFVITKSGVAKYSHLVEMLNRQVSACFRGQAAAEHALHNSMAVSAPEPAATSQPLQQAPYTFRLCTVGKNVIKVYTHTHGRDIYRAV